MDRHAFSHEYQAVYRKLWLITVGIVGGTSDADDIVQEAAIVAFNRIAEFREGSSFSAWLSEIVKRCALNYRRKSIRRKTFATDPIELDQHLDRGTAEASIVADGLAAIASDIDDDMFRVLNQIPEEARCCMLLRVIDGLSYAEISELLGIPEGTAMSHVHRSKSFARQRLNKNGSDSGGKR